MTTEQAVWLSFFSGVVSFFVGLFISGDFWGYQSKKREFEHKEEMKKLEVYGPGRGLRE